MKVRIVQRKKAAIPRNPHSDCVKLLIMT